MFARVVSVLLCALLLALLDPQVEAVRRQSAYTHPMLECKSCQDKNGSPFGEPSLESKIAKFRKFEEMRDRMGPRAKFDKLASGQNQTDGSFQHNATRTKRLRTISTDGPRKGLNAKGLRGAN